MGCCSSGSYVTTNYRGERTGETPRDVALRKERERKLIEKKNERAARTLRDFWEESARQAYKRND